MRAGSQLRRPHIFAFPRPFSRLRHAFVTPSDPRRGRSCKSLRARYLLSDSPLDFATLGCSYLEPVRSVQRICRLHVSDHAVVDRESGENLDVRGCSYHELFGCHPPSRCSHSKRGCASLLIFHNADLASGCVRVPRHCKGDRSTFAQVTAGKRYWFYGADYKIEAQLNYLERLKKITETEMLRFIAGLEMPEEFHPRPKVELPPYDPNRREFRILDFVRVGRRRSGNYWTRCPSCAQQGKDRSGDNRAISVADPRKYKCWAGCTRDMIRGALGRPISARRAG